MDEKKGLALVILGIVAVIAIVGLVLLFKSAMTGGFSITSSQYGAPKVYIAEGQALAAQGSYAIGVPYKDVGQAYGPVQVVESPTYYGAGPTQIKPSTGRASSFQTAPCYPGQVAERPEWVEWWEGDTPCRMG